MIGYSGGAIATEWAAELAPTYAPDLNKNLIGAAYGGVLVHPAHNLSVRRGHLDLGRRRADGDDRCRPCIRHRPRAVPQRERQGDLRRSSRRRRSSTCSVSTRVSSGPTSPSPSTPTPNSIPAYVAAANKVIMGTGGTPKIPMLVGQGTGGELEGTPGNRHLRQGRRRDDRRRRPQPAAEATAPRASRSSTTSTAEATSPARWNGCRRQSAGPSTASAARSVHDPEQLLKHPAGQLARAGRLHAVIIAGQLLQTAPAPQPRGAGVLH